MTINRVHALILAVGLILVGIAAARADQNGHPRPASAGSAPGIGSPAGF